MKNLQPGKEYVFYYIHVNGQALNLFIVEYVSPSSENKYFAHFIVKKKIIQLFVEASYKTGEEAQLGYDNIYPLKELQDIKREMITFVYESWGPEK